MINPVPKDIDSLQALTGELSEKVARLEARVVELETENADLRRRLGLNSSNSSKPPSSDGLKKKTVKPGLPKPEGKRNGGQEGHRGKTLERVERPDLIQQHDPVQCRVCARAFQPEDIQHSAGRQVFDLPVQKLEVTEHQIGVACGAHLLRELNGLIERGSVWAGERGHFCCFS